MGIEGFFIEHDGWIVKSIVHKMMAKYPDKQEECMNDIFLAVWRNVDRYTGEKASFRTWLTAVAKYQVLSHIRDIKYHDYVSKEENESSLLKLYDKRNPVYKRESPLKNLQI